MTCKMRPLCMAADVMKIVGLPSNVFTAWITRGILDVGDDAMGGGQGRARAISQPVAHQVAVAAALHQFGAPVSVAVELGWRFAFHHFNRELDVSDAGDVRELPGRTPGAPFSTGATVLLFAPPYGAALIRLSGSPSLPRLALETLAREAGREDGAFALIDVGALHARVAALFAVRRQ